MKDAVRQEPGGQIREYIAHAEPGERRTVQVTIERGHVCVLASFTDLELTPANARRLAAELVRVADAIRPGPLAPAPGAAQD